MPNGPFDVPNTSLLLISRKLRLLIVKLRNTELNSSKSGKSIVHVYLVFNNITDMLAKIRK